MRYRWSAFAALVTLGAAVGGQQLQAAETTATYAYIGTYTRDAPGGDSGVAQSEGIYVAKVPVCDLPPSEGTSGAPGLRPRG